MRSLKVDINYARPVVSRPGHEWFTLSSSFRGSTLQPPGKLISGTFGMGLDGLADASVWREPATNTVMLRPSPLRADWMNDPFWAPTWYRLTGSRTLRVNPAETDVQVLVESGSQPVLLRSIKPSPDVPFAGIAGVNPVVTSIDISSMGMTWVAETNQPLVANEGFSFLIQPSGTMADRSEDFFGFAFGNAFFIALQTGGTAKAYQRTPDGWILREVFAYSEGGIDNGRPFQLTVIPFGMNQISVLFSQAAKESGSNEGNASAETRQAFVIELDRYNTPAPYDSAIKDRRKTDPAPVYVAIRSVDLQVAWGLAVVRYAPGGIRLAAEVLPEPMTGQIPRRYIYGRVGMTSGGVEARNFEDAAFTNPGVGVTDENNNLWTLATTSRQCHLFTFLRPSGGGIYSPEILAMGGSFAPVIQTSDNASEYEISQYTRKINFVLSSEMNPTSAEILWNREDGYMDSMTLDGPLRIRTSAATPMVLWEGFIDQMRPVLQGSVKTRLRPDLSKEAVHTHLQTEDTLAVDLWRDLEMTPARGMQNLSRRSVGVLIEEGLTRSGWTSADWEIESDLYDIEVDGSNGSDDWKLVNDDATVADLFRALRAHYGLQGRGPLRIVRRDGKWRANMPAAWVPGESEPDGFFNLAGGAVEQYFGLGTDLERYDADQPVLRMLDNLEWTISAPGFNSLSAYCATKTGAGADALAVYIAQDPRERSGFNATFQPRVKSRYEVPAMTAMTSTLEGLARWARRLYDEEGRTSIRTTIGAEWQPGVWPDQVFVVLGQAPGDNVSLGIDVGDIVSYGAWRIEQISVEATHDDDDLEAGGWGASSPVMPSRIWSRLGDYACVYVGPWENDDIPMFTELARIPEVSGL